MGGRIVGRLNRPWAWALVVLVFSVLACGSPQAPPAEVQKGKAAREGIAAPSHVKRPDIGFASRQKLVDHYKKHGREFDAITMEQYLRKAQELRDRPAGGAILESARPDGVGDPVRPGIGGFHRLQPRRRHSHILQAGGRGGLLQAPVGEKALRTRVQGLGYRV